jgi:hypothetical protein
LTFAPTFVLLVGLGMLGQWGFSLARGQVPQLRTEPLRIAFYLAAEGLTAAGLGLLAGAPWNRQVYLVATGMLLYTCVASPGCFAQRRQWPMVGMFGVLLALTLLSLGLVLRGNAPFAVVHTQVV